MSANNFKMKSTAVQAGNSLSFCAVGSLAAGGKRSNGSLANDRPLRLNLRWPAFGCRVVISLCGCGINLPPEWVIQAVFEDWQLDDPAENPAIFPAVRDEIKARVATLIARLSANPIAR